MNDLTGKPNPGPEYKSEGYTFEEIGPTIFEGKGTEEMDKDILQIIERGKWLAKTRSPGGCLIGFS